MKTEEIEALAKAYTEAVAKEHGCSPGSVTWDIAGLEAVARAVRAQDEARGGTLTAEEIAEATRDMTSGDSAQADWLEYWGDRFLSHFAAQGRTIAALEAAYAGLERTINADTDGKLALRKAHGARDDETYPAFVARLARERDELLNAVVPGIRARAETAESAHATLRQAVESLEQKGNRLANAAGDLSQNDALPEATRQRLAEDARAWDAARKDAFFALSATPAEHPDTAGVRAIRELVEDYATRMDAKAAESDSVRQEPGERPTRMGSDALSIDCRARASAARDILKMLGDSGPSGGGETCSKEGHSWVGDDDGPCMCGVQTRTRILSAPLESKPTTPQDEPETCDDCGAIVGGNPDCAACFEWVRKDAAKPTTPPDGAASMDADMRSVMAMTPEQVDSELRASGVDPEAFTERMKKHVSTVRARLAASERPADVFAPMPDENAEPALDGEPTPEEDWRTVEFIPGLLQTFGHMAMAEEMRKALARLKSEPRRAAEAMRKNDLRALAKMADEAQRAGENDVADTLNAAYDSLRALPL